MPLRCGECHCKAKPLRLKPNGPIVNGVRCWSLAVLRRVGWQCIVSTDHLRRMAHNHEQLAMWARQHGRTDWYQQHKRAAEAVWNSIAMREAEERAQVS